MTDLERIKKDVVEMDSRANVCWYDTKVLTKAVRLILEELTADRKTEPQPTTDCRQTDCYMCKWLGEVDVCGRCRNRNLFAEADTEPKPKDEPQMVTEAERQYRLLKEAADEAWNKYEANKVEDEPQAERKE